VLQRLIAALLGLLGLASVGLGVASATAWRADDPLIATAEPGGGTRTLVTDPGVLELAGDPVTVSVRADGSPVVLAVGRDTDVDAWIGSDPYERVTGMSDWHTLATTTGEPSGGAEPAADPAAEAAATPSPSASEAPAAPAAADPTGSDMWVLEAAGDGTATLEWPATDGRWSLIAVSLGDTAPVLDLSWPQEVTTPWLWPLVALGVLLLAVAAVLLVRILRRRRAGDDTVWHSVTTGTFATVPAPPGSAASAGTAPRPGAPGTADGGSVQPAGAIPVGTVTPEGAPLTRRQIRELEQAARQRGRRPATGAVPVVTGAVPTVTGTTPAVPPPHPGAGDGAHGSATTSPSAGSPAPAAAADARSGGPVGDTSAATPVRGVPVRAADAADPAEPGRGRPTATGAGAAPAQGAPAEPPPDGPGQEPGPVAGSTGDRLRGLAGRVLGRRGAGTSATADAAPPAEPAPGWTPAPGETSGTPLTGGAATGAGTPAALRVEPAGGTGGPAAPVQRVVPGAPSAPGVPRVPGTPDAPGAPDDEEAARAQRADAWRRMWGFPADSGTAGGTTQDTHPTEEGR
jgi:hypothetical protein